MNTKIIESRHVVELLLTGVIALLMVQFYNRSPIAVAIGAIGIAIAIPLCLKRLDYAVLFLIAILPFRDIHLISIIHLKRFVIWGLLIYILIQQVSAPRVAFSRSLSRFTTVALVFVAMLALSLVKTASELYQSIYLTKEMLKTTIFSDALAIVEQILILYIIYYTIKTHQQIQRLLDVMLLTSVIVAILGIIEYMIAGVPSGLSFLFDPDVMYHIRASSVFSNPNGFGVYLAPLVVIAFSSFIWGQRSKTIRFCFLLPIFLIDSAGMFLSFSRTAIVQILFSMLVLGYLYYAKISRKTWSWKVLLIAMLNVGLIFSAIRYYETFAQLRARSRDPAWALAQIKATSDIVRKHSAMTTLRTFLQYPFLGIGYEVITGKRIESVQWVENQYLKILAEMGLLGFIPFIIMLGLIINTGLRIWDPHREPHVSHEVQIVMVILVTAVSTHMFGYLFATYLNNIQVTGTFGMLSGTIFVLEHATMPTTTLPLKGIRQHEVHV